MGGVVAVSGRSYLGVGVGYGFDDSSSPFYSRVGLNSLELFFYRILHFVYWCIR